MDIDKEKSMELSTNAINSNVLHAHAYKAVALIDCGFGFRSAQEELNMYFAQIENDEIEMFDPIAFFAIYSIWKGAYIYVYMYVNRKISSISKPVLSLKCTSNRSKSAVQVDATLCIRYITVSSLLP